MNEYGIYANEEAALEKMVSHWRLFITRGSLIVALQLLYLPSTHVGGDTLVAV